MFLPIFSSLLSSLWGSRTGSASDWCALQEALYKFIDTIQYNTIQSVVGPNLPIWRGHQSTCMYVVLPIMRSNSYDNNNNNNNNNNSNNESLCFCSSAVPECFNGGHLYSPHFIQCTVLWVIFRNPHLDHQGLFQTIEHFK